MRMGWKRITICRMLGDGHQQTPSSQPGCQSAISHSQIPLENSPFSSMRRFLQLAIVKPYYGKSPSNPTKSWFLMKIPWKFTISIWRNPMETWSRSLLASSSLRSLGHSFARPQTKALNSAALKLHSFPAVFGEKSQNSLLWSRIYGETIGISLVFGGEFCSSTNMVIYILISE